MITIQVVQEFIKTDIIPIKDAEILLLRDIVRDNKQKVLLTRGSYKLIEFSDIEELLDYQITIDPIRLQNLNDKKRLLIKSNKKNRIYKQKF